MTNKDEEIINVSEFVMMCFDLSGLLKKEAGNFGICFYKVPLIGQKVN